MKSILVPIDFSKCAYNAIQYAIELAKVTKAKIILLHTYEIPTPPPDTHIKHNSIYDLQEKNMDQLKKVADFELSINNGDSTLEIECVVMVGLVVEKIIEAAKQYKAGLIVIGTLGASGIIKKYIVGSNTANVIAKATYPVLAIPENAKYLGFNKLVFAADFHQIKNNSLFDPILEIALLFDSDILIFFVHKDASKVPSMAQAFEELNLDKVFERVPHTFHSAVSEDIPVAIDQFIHIHHPDLLVTIPQKHRYLEFIFNRSTTRSLVFQADVPILTLPEQTQINTRPTEKRKPQLR